MENRLFLIDNDLTMVNINYQPTVPLPVIREQAEMLKARGDKIGLISDTGFETLKQWMEKFSFYGPIISERGALITWPNGETHQTVKLEIDWLLLKREIINVLSQKFPKGYIIEVHYSDFIGSRESRKEIPAETEIVIIINPYRRCSFSLHVRGWHNNDLVEDISLFKIIELIIREHLAKKGIVDRIMFDANFDYSVIILSEKQVKKSLAIPILRKRYSDYKIVAIGDGLSDAELKDQVDLLCAVANAANALKGVADIVAEKPITAGVIEILKIVESIVNQREGGQ